MKTKDTKNKNRRRITTCIIIIIAIILLLLTSCNSNLFGRIGELFVGSSNHIVNPGDADKEIILNKQLKFDDDYAEISVDDKNFKISYSYELIDPDLFTCTTSNAEIATCVAMDGYVEINPKSKGEVSVYVETDTNGKIYRGSTKLKISKSSKYISLSSKSGRVILTKNKTIKVIYNLVGIKGDVSVDVENSDIASAKASKGVLTITGKKEGKTKIVLSVKYNGTTYKNTYTLNVLEKAPTTTTTTNKTTKKTTTKDSNNKTTTKKKTTKKTSSKKTTKKTSASDKTTKTTKKTSGSTSSTKTTKKTSSSKTTKPTTSSSTSKTTKPTTSSSTSTTKKTSSSTSSTSSTKKTSSSSSTSTSTTSKVQSTDSTLKNIVVSVGELNPTFKSNVLNYEVTVDSDVDKITVTATKNDSSSRLIYKYKNQVVDNLKDLELTTGDNKVNIIVVAENGDNSIYTVNIIKEASSDNYLKELEFEGYDLDPAFKKETTDYILEIDWDQDILNGKYKLNDKKSTIELSLNGTVINSLNNLSIIPGGSILEITVTAENGNVKYYTVSIYRKIRSISIDKDEYEFKIEDKPFNIPYKVYEGRNEIQDYDIDDIELDILSNFKGSYEIKKGYIIIDPSIEDIDIEYVINLKYANVISTAKLYFDTYDYYFNIYNDEYDVVIENGTGSRNIIFNTNILDNNLEVININNGIRVKSKDFRNGYVDIISSDLSIIKPEFVIDEQTGNTSFKVKVVGKSAGNATLTLVSSVFNKQIATKVIELNVIAKYNITLDANGGYFTEFADVYKFLVESNEEIDLSEYPSYKVDKSGNCLYYTHEGFNTLSDGTGTSYQLNHVLTNFTEDITIYSIYSDQSHYEEIQETSRLYLTEIDLFHNEEYYELYNEDKVIYPGAKGAHIMTIDNNSGETLTLKKFNLEEDTICISNGKCLNMGYIIKYAKASDDNYTYYYGSENEYKILNKDSNTTHTTGTLTGYHTENNIALTPEIVIPDGEEIEVSILWQWVSVDDETDTAIGNHVVNINDLYTLTVSIDFEKTNTYCTIGG